MSTTLEEIDDEDQFYKSLKSSPKIVAFFYSEGLEDFYSIKFCLENFPNTFPELKPIMSEIEYMPKIKEKYKIKINPTLIIFINGREKSRITTSDEETINNELAKICPNSKGARNIKEYPNISHIKTIKEYENLINSNTVLISYFYFNWCPENNKFNTALNHFAKNNPKFKFVKIKVNEAVDIGTIEKIDSFPTFIFYYNSKFSTRLEVPDFRELEQTISDYDDNNQNGQVIKSKFHKHFLMKKNKFNICCNVCDEPILNKTDIYFCLDCRFCLCQDCKNEEDGMPKAKKYDEFNIIKTIKDFKDFINENNKVVALFYEPLFLCKAMSYMKKLVKNYSFLSFCKIKRTKETDVLFRKYKVNKTNIILIENGNDVNSLNVFIPYQLNHQLFKFSGMKLENYFKYKEHGHQLGLMMHWYYVCEICKRKMGEGMLVPTYRCLECLYDICEECKNKEEQNNNNN